MKPFLPRSFRIAVAAGLTAAAAAAEPTTPPGPPYEQALDQARALVARMTLSEKILEVHGLGDRVHRRFVPGIPRLGIPALTITNGPAGAGPGDPNPQQPATALPAPISLAATWNPDLARRYGQVAGQEARSLGNQLLESPDVNLARVPQGGRVFEAFGEDPYLDARMAVAEIEGIQSTGELANVKHYIANDQEADRRSVDTIVPERALREIYMPAFEAAVKEARVASLMAAYPRVNGQFCTQNRFLLHDVLEAEWGFDGFITSDFGAVHSTVPCALAGLDLELPRGKYFAGALERAVRDGAVPMSVIDDMLVRRFAKMIEFGWFAPQPQPAPIPARRDGLIDRRIAAQGMVLLKNGGGILPLDGNLIRSVALVGPYAVRAATGGGGSSHVVPLYTVLPADGLRADLRPGTPLTVLDGSDVDAAADAARRADVAIVMLGDRDSEGHDHPIQLPDADGRLVEAVARANPRTIVVLKTGSAVLLPWLDRVAAVLEAWYPGEEDGNAVADVLFGRVNPSGKLPLSFPRRVDDTLARNPRQYPGVDGQVDYTEGLDVGYRGYEAAGIRPLFPFGFGLSYTAFRFDGLEVRQGPGAAEATLKVRLTNTGRRAGADIVQAYLGYPSIAEGDEPPSQLRAFARVELAPGATKTVVLRLDRRAFSYWSARAHAWKVAAGRFTVKVGDSSEDLPLSGTIDLP